MNATSLKNPMITMRDVAAKAGVSQPMVSYVLNGKKNGISIREETRERIVAAAAELGYRPNELARAMMRGQSKVLGFLTRNPGAEYVARFMVGAIDEADERGYFIKVMRVRGENPAGVDNQILDQCISLRLSGVIAAYLSPELVMRYHEELGRYNIPLALLDDVGTYSWGSPVLADYGMGMQQAVDHLVELGHRQIGYVGGMREQAGKQARFAGFWDALAAHGLSLDPRHVIESSWDIEEMVATVRAGLENPSHRPTAMVCATDATAHLVMRAARSLGIALPDQLSLVSFGDLTVSALSDPPLTTIHHPFEKMGRLAAHELINRTEARVRDDAPMPPLFGAKVPTHLVVRESTAKI